ncbi:hypothetical protein GCM10009623_30340 [Nocardioides aestuarii]
MVVVLAAAGCRAAGDDTSSGEEQAPALRPVGSFHDVCLPTSPGRTGWVGLDTFRNRSDTDVVVEGASWGEEGLEVREISYVVRDEDSRFATLGLTNFPTSSPRSTRPGSPDWAWRRRERLDDARLPPSAPGEYYVVLVGFDGRRGSGGPLEIDYAAEGGRSDTLTTRVTLSAAPRC